MTSLPRKKLLKPKPAATKKTAKPKASARAKPSIARADTPKPPLGEGKPKLEKSTKQERVLTLLSRPEGASVAEMMQATGWQQHSVRGFLAGTVKGKLGFPLESFKKKDGVRRYRIDALRSR